MSSPLGKVTSKKCHSFRFQILFHFDTRLHLEEFPKNYSHGIITKIDKIFLQSNEFVNFMFLSAQYALNINQGI